ncbi:outer membrane protein assembly factor BamD [Buchnera aphidicola (Taiwanaphis decaspermi)]|uniref:outer membrane protein assembly factor BamD n=1 Tax=Buchnera aphidicola TaxID=9 RepID=UPI0031B7EBCD
MKKILKIFKIILINILFLNFCYANEINKLHEKIFINNNTNKIYKKNKEKKEIINYKQQINLINKYYLKSNFYKAYEIINKTLPFLNTKTNKIDYFIYMKGVINMKLDQKKFLLFLPYVNYNINPIYAIKALNYFSYLIKLYPNSKYSIDVRKRIKYLKHRIFKYELSIIKFNFNNKNYFSVIKRSQLLIKKKCYLYENKLANNYIILSKKILKIH